jgi:hypothetical protein
MSAAVNGSNQLVVVYAGPSAPDINGQRRNQVTFASFNLQVGPGGEVVLPEPQAALPDPVPTEEAAPQELVPTEPAVETPGEEGEEMPEPVEVEPLPTLSFTPAPEDPDPTPTGMVASFSQERPQTSNAWGGLVVGIGMAFIIIFMVLGVKILINRGRRF